MAILNPAVALSTCETALRELLSYAYTAKFGPKWLRTIASPNKIAEWEERAVTESRARGSRGAAHVPDAGLSYANFYDLLSITRAHWEPLAAALGKKAAIVPLLERFDSLRNAVGHSRPLLLFEQDLLSGIAGQIRNQVTIYMSAQDEAGDIYPRIESITDSFGRRIECARVEGELAGAIRANDIMVHPGDRVTFECVAVDPQDRDLSWSIGAYPARTSSVRSASGVPTTLAWTFTDSNVTETFDLEICMATHEAPYHRFGQFDHRVYFRYRVRPPR